MGNPSSKIEGFMEQRERTNTEHRKTGTLSMNLVREEFNRDIQEVYDLRSGELLGKGGFGTVRVVTHKATGTKYALKTIELKDVETVEQYEFLLNEIQIMKQLDHPNIARVQEVFHTPDHYYMVMDLYTGGDMYARYKIRSEDETAKIVNKLINALRYCHDRNIAHRDIKLENICFESMADDAEVKLVDFGLSASFKDEQMRHDLVGSWAFMAPDVLQRAHHPQACDMWSMGVITYCLLAGFPPFRSVNLKGLKEQILFSKVTFEEEPWKNVSTAAKDFILKLLKKDPLSRLTAQQAQHHPWLTRAHNKKNAKLSNKVVENLRQFKSLNLMKRVALGVVARTLEASEMRNLEQEFHKADIARSGEISIEDFRAVLLRTNQFPRKEIDEIFEGLDIGSSGVLSYTDFTAAALNRQYLDTRRLRYAFERLDHDNNGFLDYQDLMMTVGSDLSNEAIRTAIKQFDTDGKGQVSFDDFCKGMRSTGGALDALSTAHLTSGYMVDSIAKGEGAAAIKTLVDEEEQVVHPISTEKLIPPLRQQLMHRQRSGGVRANGDGLARNGGVAGGGGSSVRVETGAGVAGASRAVGGEAAGAGGSSSIESLGRNSFTSSAETAAMSRPQSLDGQGATGALPADTGSAVGTETHTNASGPRSRPIAVPDDEAVAVAVAAAGVEGTSIGAGGEEATAPAERKGSQEGPPVGGAHVDAPLSPRDRAAHNTADSRSGVEEAPPQADGGAGAVVFGGGSAVGTTDFLANRRMRDSIRLRAGLAGLPLHPLGTTPPSSSALETSFLSAQPSLSKGGVGMPSSTQAPVSGVSPNLALEPSSMRAGLAPSMHSQGSHHPRGAAAAAGARAGARAGAGTGGVSGAAHGSTKSGGEPAESSENQPNSFFRKKTTMVQMIAADLPPKDSTAGEADLGWGDGGSPGYVPSPQGSSISSLSGAVRTPGGGVAPASKAKDVKKRGKQKRGSWMESCNGSRRQQQGSSFFCTPVARRASDNGGGGGGGGGSRTMVGGGDDDIYRNYDDVNLGDDAGFQNRKRTGTFCLPGVEPEAGIPGWMRWIGGVFGGTPA